jgi:Domain of unknown function (DUF4349)
MRLPSCRSRLLCTLPFFLALIVVQTGCSASPPPSAPKAYAGALAPEPALAAPSQESMAAPAPAAPSQAPFPGAPSPAPPSTAARTAAEAKTAPDKPADTKSAKNAGPSTRAPVIIYQGDLKMMADEDAIPKTIDKIIDVAESVGGHIASRKDLSVQIKVPSASFRDAMTKIEALGGVVNRSVAADDVSEEFHDLEVRLVNLRATRTRLQEFLAKAPAINDMLTVERELERVAEEIDRSEGRLEFLRTRAAMSAITVTLAAKPRIVAPIVIKPPPAQLRTIDLPIPWLGDIGIDPLLSLKK